MILLSASKANFLRIDLLPLDDHTHAGWHSYRIMAGLQDGVTVDVLESTEDVPLFLDSVTTPEIPCL